MKYFFKSKHIPSILTFNYCFRVTGFHRDYLYNFVHSITPLSHLTFHLLRWTPHIQNWSFGNLSTK